MVAIYHGRASAGNFARASATKFGAAGVLGAVIFASQRELADVHPESGELLEDDAGEAAPQAAPQAEPAADDV